MTPQAFVDRLLEIAAEERPAFLDAHRHELTLACLEAFKACSDALLMQQPLSESRHTR